MPPRPRTRKCPTIGCPHLILKGETDCELSHAAVKRKAAQHRTDAQRPPPRARGYDRAHATRFRNPVLRRDPLCVLCHKAPSTDADHHPNTRAELISMGLDPNDPRWGRGLCHPCHSSETAKHDGGYGNRTATHKPA